MLLQTLMHMDHIDTHQITTVYVLIFLYCQFLCTEKKNNEKTEGKLHLQNRFDKLNYFIIIHSCIIILPRM